MGFSLFERESCQYLFYFPSLLRISLFAVSVPHVAHGIFHMVTTLLPEISWSHRRLRVSVQVPEKQAHKCSPIYTPVVIEEPPVGC